MIVIGLPNVRVCSGLAQHGDEPFPHSMTGVKIARSDLFDHGGRNGGWIIGGNTNQTG